MKTCSRCGGEKPLDEFYASQSICKECAKDNQTLRNWENRGIRDMDLSLPNTEIADALGLTDVTARQLKKRGFDRLRRIAQEEGYTGQEFGLPEIDFGDDEGDSDDE